MSKTVVIKRPDSTDVVNIITKDIIIEMPTNMYQYYGLFYAVGYGYKL